MRAGAFAFLAVHVWASEGSGAQAAPAVTPRPEKTKQVGAPLPEIPVERIAAWMRPFWRSNRLEGEPVLFMRNDEKAQASAMLLFPPDRVLEIRNSTGDLVYKDGLDYRWEPGSRTLVLPPGSRIPAFRPEDLRRPAGTQAYKLKHRDGQGEIYFGRNAAYAKMQVAVTYIHPDEWKNQPQGFAGDVLSGTIDRLKKHRNLSMLVLGDSISTGADASAKFREAPFQPGYPELVSKYLTMRYDTRIEVKNISVGGKSTDWAVTQVGEVLKAKPHLVILAFGMNDAGGRSPGEFRSNMQKIITDIRAALPATEFILVAPMLGNPDWAGLQPALFPAYRDALKSLSGPGIAVADLTTVWTDFLALKRYADLTGNGVNHPNDFGHRIYAQVIAALLVAEDAPGGQPPKK